ncbi:MAG: hypothetical protein AB1757_16740 [Acidobacteriota bacterium]
MNKFCPRLLVKGFFIVFAWISLTTGLQAQSPNAAQIFKAKGQSAFAVLQNIEINGTTYPRVNLTVTHDSNSGTTRLLLQVFDGNLAGNATRHNLSGAIANSDFVLAADLSSATLNTIISTSGNNFNNLEVGAVSNLAINLAWNADAIGTVVDTFVFNVNPVGSNQGFRETFHQNGPHAECTVTGAVDDGNDGMNVNTINSFGSLDSNRAIDISQIR